MKKRAYLILVLAMLAGCLACAHAQGANDYCGIWVARGMAVEIWSENGEARSRAVRTDGSGNADVWEYHACIRQKDALEFGGVSRTREHYDSRSGAIEELDWSLNDMAFSSFQLVDDALLFTDEALDAPVSLTRLTQDGSKRAQALRYVGLWKGEAGEVRVEDHGTCAVVTVTVPVDEKTAHRWSYTCTYDSKNQRVISTSVSPLTIITKVSDGTEEVQEDNDAGSAAFTLEGEDRLIWKTGKGAAAFERIAP